VARHEPLLLLLDGLGALALSGLSLRDRYPWVLAGLFLLTAGMLGASAQTADQDFATLRGRWLRPDGGYILDIRKVGADGTIDAVYLNPRPINISKARATRDRTTVRVFVELRAPNYPGSTYTLTYDPKRDELYGVYFQAAQGQSFDVVFVRTK
jgi:hypothetical protein